MELTRAQVADVLGEVFPVVPGTEFRLVGTASSVLRGIDLPASDIDVLFRDRAGVDGWFEVLQLRCDVETTPEWIPDAQQYFARLRVAGVALELSTVEADTEDDTMECFGPGPWCHFDVLDVGGVVVPAVASELRLITEFGRSRLERYQPVLDFLRVRGCDLELVRRGLAHLGTESCAIDWVVAELAPRRHS